ATQNIEVAGKGEAEPVTGAACERLGPEQRKNRKLVDCLQPDRRVEIEVFGTRTASSASRPARAGATRRPLGCRCGGRRSGSGRSFAPAPYFLFRGDPVFELVT